MSFAMASIQLTRHVLFVSLWLGVSMSRIISGNIDVSIDKKPVWKDGRNVPQSHHEKKKKKCTSQSRQYFLKPSLHYSLHGNLLLYFTLVRFIILLCGAIKYFFSCSSHCFCFTYLCVCSAVVDCSAFPHCRVS